MDKQRFVEYYFCDAMRLALHLAGKYDGVISEGIGNACEFPIPDRFNTGSEDLRFLRVEGVRDFEVGFVSQDVPPSDAIKHRNKSLYRLLVGEELKRFRQSRGISLKDAAQKSGFRMHSLEMVEEGRYDFDIAQLGAILDAIGARVKITDRDEAENG